MCSGTRRCHADAQQGKHVCGDSWLLFSLLLSRSPSFSLSLLHIRTHTHTAYSVCYLFLTYPKGPWTYVPSLNNTIRNLLLPQDTVGPPSACVCHFFTILCTVLILTWLSKQGGWDHIRIYFSLLIFQHVDQLVKRQFYLNRESPKSSWVAV